MPRKKSSDNHHVPRPEAKSYKAGTQNRVLMLAADARNHTAIVTIHSPKLPAGTLGISLPMDVVGELITDLNAIQGYLLSLAS